MSTLTEILLIIVISTLTITLTIIGIQLFLILRDLRDKLKKVDPILENVILEQECLNEILSSAKSTSQKVSSTTEYLSEEVLRPVGEVVSAIKSFSNLTKQFRSRKKTPRKIESKTDERSASNE